jgi:hypothetical protein
MSEYDFFQLRILDYIITVKPVRYLWFSERNEIDCKVYLIFSIAIVIKNRIRN